MARLMFPGNGKIRWVTTLTSTTAPTVAQVTAGVDLTPWLRQDGLNRTITSALTDVADARDTFDRTDIGTYSATMEITFLRDSVEGNDDAFTTLTRGARGYMIVAPFGFTGVAGAPLATDRVEVWPCVVSSRGPEAEGKEKAQVIKITFGLYDSPELEAEVAA